MQTKLTNRQLICIQFFLTRSLFLGEGFSLIYTITNKDSWISIIIGYFMGIILIFLFDKLSKKINYSLIGFFRNKKVIFFLITIIFISFCSFLYFFTSITLTNFIKNFYLYATPEWFIILPLIIITYYGSLKKETCLGKVCEISAPISIFISIIIGIILLNFGKFEHFLPIMVESNMSIFKSALIFAVLSFAPNILTLNDPNSLKTKIKGYSLGVLSLLFIDFFITFVLGKFYMMAFSYPELMVLKKIKVLSFIDNVDKIASLLWYFDILVLQCYSLIKFNNVLTQRKAKIITPIILLIIFFIFNKSIISLKIIFILFNNISFILSGFIILFLLIFLFKKRRI